MRNDLTHLNKETQFLRLYKTIQERERFMNNGAKIIQYGAIIRYFMKFLQGREEYSQNVRIVLFWVYAKLGDIYYE